MRCEVWSPLQSLSNRTLPAGKKEKVLSEERERDENCGDTLSLAVGQHYNIPLQGNVFRGNRTSY